jgi:hypothetical protein
MQTRRLISGIAGSLLLAGTLVETWLVNLGLYQDHYLFPMEKYGVITPLRWRDRVFIVVFWSVVMALFYLSYRLLHYALRRTTSITA